MTYYSVIKRKKPTKPERITFKLHRCGGICNDHWYKIFCWV